MNKYSFTDNNGKTWKRITKKQARDNETGRYAAFYIALWRVEK